MLQLCYRITGMATAKIIAIKHHKKADGKINMKLCVYHKSQRVYLPTNHTVVESQLKKDYTVKDSQKDLKAEILADELKYIKKIRDLDWRLDTMTAKELGEHLVKPDQSPVVQVDFIAFSREYIQGVRDKGKESTAGSLQAVVNNLVNFLKTDVIYISAITSKMLKEYENYLSRAYRQERVINGSVASFNRKPMKESSLFSHMNYFRLLFNAARNKYNDLDTGNIVIANYPFKAYQPKPPKESIPKAVDIKTVKMVRDVKVPPGSRAELASDIFMLSFYMLGMNAKDLFKLTEVPNGRLEYNRAKTEDKRRDSAFISVKIIPEARVLLNKYAGKLSVRYSTVYVFRWSIKHGMDSLVELLDVPKFTFYSARHTVATEARNTLGFSVADIGEALNHSREESSITDTYIKKNWSKLDEIQSGVVALLDPV